MALLNGAKRESAGLPPRLPGPSMFCRPLVYSAPVLLWGLLLAVDSATALRPLPVTPPPRPPMQEPRTSPIVHAMTLGVLLCVPCPSLAGNTMLPLVRSSEVVLHEPAHSVETFDEELATLSRNMFDIMYDSGGIGLAG